jgi:hypothetical protein
MRFPLTALLPMKSWMSPSSKTLQSMSLFNFSRYSIVKSAADFDFEVSLFFIWLVITEFVKVIQKLRKSKRPFLDSGGFSWTLSA